MNIKICKEIYKKIKKFDTIVIARHVGPDPDALGSQIGLKEIIEQTFPNKKIYTAGLSASRFKYLGNLNYDENIDLSKALLIVTDTPDPKRVDGADAKNFAYSIKIDHHPFVEKFCNLEWVDETASSAAQMIIELVINTKLKIDKEAAEKLYIGLVADTGRFMFSYTTPKTFDLVSWLIRRTGMQITPLYESLYLRPFKELKFQGYIENNLQITKHGFAYMKLDEQLLNEYNADAGTAGNMVNNLNYIEGVYAWGLFSFDKTTGNIRGSIRSRGPIVNTVAASFGGGGHIYASGVRLASFDDVDKIVDALDEVCESYINELESK